MRVRLIVAASVLLASCVGSGSVPAGCEVMSDPSACNPSIVHRTEVLPQGRLPASRIAEYCGAVGHLVNALQLYTENPPRAQRLLRSIDKGDVDRLGFDPTTCY